MASQGYYDWLKAEKPYTLIRPARALVGVLQSHGLTVFHYPDEAHLKAATPQDHTPFSVTGWPTRNARWNARGVDVMPRDSSAAAAKENADIARQLIRDRDAGVPGVLWIKYINWTDEKGVCRQERWTSGGNIRTTVFSSDEGHIHVSGRSDVDNDYRADGYDPIARMKGDTMTTLDDKATCADGGARTYAQLILDLWNGFYQGGGEPQGEGPLAKGDYDTRFPRSLWADLSAILTEVKGLTGSVGGGVTHAELVTALKEALQDPAVAAVLAQAAFDGAQRAEGE